MSGDTTLKLYVNRKVANELIEIIKDGQKKGQSKTTIIKTMTDLIQKYFVQGILMSSHQKAGAIDIAVVGDAATGVPIMTSAQQ